MAYEVTELRDGILSFFEEGQKREKFGGIEWNGMRIHQGRRVWAGYCQDCGSNSPTHRCPLLVRPDFSLSSSKKLRSRRGGIIGRPGPTACQNCGSTGVAHNCPVVSFFSTTSGPYVAERKTG
jgi:hypothetical protein